MERNTDVKIKCFKCGKLYTMDMMRIGPDGKNLVCRNCLDRKTAQKQELTKSSSESKALKEEPMKEYFCKACKYNFTRAKHLAISTCPNCGSSGSLLLKGSTAKIISDASKMKG